MKRRILVALLFFLGLGARPASADVRLIVRTTGGLLPLQSLCKLIGCNVVRSLGDPLSQLFLVSAPDTVSRLGSVLNLVGVAGITNVELDLPLSMLPGSSLVNGIPSGLTDTRPVLFYGSTVWSGYATQPAGFIVRSQQAQLLYGFGSGTIVSIIDTGVDPHPALRNNLLPGYDFIRNEANGGSETGAVNQSTTSVVDGGGSPRQVNSWAAAPLSQSTTAVVDDGGHEGFGHGTMVAGVVHLVAPMAMILPARAFSVDGTGYTSDVLRAVYWSIQSNARVINMSFSMKGYSREFQNAVDYAAKRGVICVSSAGNDSSNIAVYPAAFDNVMGVGSTNNNDQRSSFSNYGSADVWVAAPGEGIITTYPYSTYAAAWGTSFSAPFVSGTAALIVSAQPSSVQSTAANAIAHAKDVGQDLGHGRLDIVQAINALR